MPPKFSINPKIKEEVLNTESKNNYFEKEKLLKEIKESANYQGNHSELFLERLKDQNFLEKLVNTLYEDIKGRDQDFQPNKSYIENSEEIMNDIREEINEKVNKVFLSTSIDFSSDESISDSDFDVGIVGYKNKEYPCFGEEYLNSYQKNIVEAHEKGHNIRNFTGYNKDFKNKILSAFDFSKIEISNDVFETLKKYKLSDTNISIEEKENIESIELEDLIESEIEYNSNLNEIIERMAQLRNYFGMKYGQEFTKEHLDYIIENYSKDTGFYLQIQPFLQAITTQTEKKFLELINELPL